MDKSEVVSVGGRIREVRLNAGLTQTVFGQEVGVSLPTVNRVENGQRSPDADMLVQINSKFGVDLNWLLVGVAEKKDPEISGAQIPLFSKLSEELIENAQEDVEALLDLPGVPLNAVSCRCYDDACAPEVSSGDIVVFVPGNFNLGNTVVVCDQWGNGLVRKIQRQDEKLVFVPTRSSYELLSDDEVSPLGVVWGVFKRFK
jgi:transcriptional regulator with XRE-family HTH domain